MKRSLLVVLLLVFSMQFTAQTFNQYNENGKRHGVWRKYFDGTKVLRYEGTFKNGKEIGTFKFYKNVKGEAVLSATRAFSDNTDLAEVTFFASSGKIISQGMMRGKTYIGLWKYYQKNSDKLLTVENYNDNGALHGERIVFYDNGEIAEKAFYKEDKLHGEAFNYSLKGVMLKSLIYKDGELHGEAKFYNPKGELIAKGIYKEGKKHGVWTYFENGEIVNTKTF
ncbi:MAG: toxin-antitoxin system YwqK family antitoxin [Jejuia sp.]